MTNAPRKGSRGEYQSPGMDQPIGFTVERIEGNLCWSRYDHRPDVVEPFIWRFRDGLNLYHTWPGKSDAEASA